MANIQQEEGIAKSNNMLLICGAFVYVINLIWYGYPCIQGLTESSDMTYNIIHFFQNKLPLFLSPYLTLCFALVLILMYCWGHRRPKTTKYIPPKIMRWIISFLVAIKLHPEFEYTVTSDKNGKPALEKKRERIEGQFTLILGIFLVLASVLPITLINSESHWYIIGFVLYCIIGIFGFLYILLGSDLIHSMAKDFEVDDNDSNNDLQESFMQFQEKIEDEYSVNWRTEFKYQGKVMNGWINLVNPFRATQVIGTPGSGKSYSVINEVIRQHLAKGFCMYCYDFKFPDLSTIVYNHALWNSQKFLDKYGVQPKFCVINFDDPRKSLRCNPIDAKFMGEIMDAYDSAYTIMLNLNKSWSEKQGDFFVESPINYLTSCIWYLKNVEGGKYCTLPHVLELINSSYTDCIPLMSVYPELNNYMAAFFEAWEGGAQDQLQGQIASARIPLSRISSPALYWVMTGNDFTLDLNNPEEPKILCVGNNSEKKAIYTTALGLFNGRIVKIINKKNKHKITLVIDELPTIHFKGLDELIATARSNKVATVLGYQDFSQLKRDYGDKEATAIINTIGNTFAGLVTGETAKTLENQFGKNKQKRKSVSMSDSGESVSISEQNDTMIPASKISTLTQGNFVGTLSDNFGQEISEKRFFAKILIDRKKIKEEESLYRPLPQYYNFDGWQEAVKMRNIIIDYLSECDNYILDVLLHLNNKATKSEIVKLPNDKTIDVKYLLNLIKTPEGDKNHRMLSFLSDYGKKMRKELLNLTSNLNVSLYKLNDENSSLVKNEMLITIENFRKSDIIKDLYKSEKSSYANSLMQGKKFSDVINELESDVKKLVITEDSLNEYIEYFDDYVSKFSYLEKSVNRISDEKMKRVLESNSKKVRNDIKELIKRELQRLYYNDRDGLWLRRLKANKLKEIEELKRIGLEFEAEKLMRDE